jgi:adenylate cyclase
MPVEIERKFLVPGDFPTENTTPLQQAYLSLDPHRTIRVRIAGELAFLTIKGIGQNITRPEFEYPIPLDDARQLLELRVGALIQKVRHRIPHAGHTWEIDVFTGDNQGLVVAEIELTSENEPFETPPWLGEEVTHDPRYLNANLAQSPSSSWPDR